RVLFRSLNWPGAENCVVKHAFHAVAVTGVFRDAEQIARDFEMAVGSAGRFEARMGIGQAVAELSYSRLPEGLIRSPPARGEALRRQQHLEAILCGSQVALASPRGVSLPRPTARRGTT